MKIIKNQTIKEIEENTKYIGCIVLLDHFKTFCKEENTTFENCSFRSRIENHRFSCLKFINCNFIRLDFYKDYSDYEKCYIHELNITSLEDLKFFVDCHIHKITTQHVKNEDLEYLERIEGLTSLKLRFDGDPQYLKEKYNPEDWKKNFNVYFDEYELRYKPLEFSGEGLKYLQKFSMFQELFLSETCITIESFKHISKLKNLEKLRLGRIRERLLPDLQNLEKRKRVSICEELDIKEILDPVKKSLEDLGQLQELKYLDLKVEKIILVEDRFIEDEDLYGIKKLNNLTHLNLGYTNATIEGVKYLSELTNLKCLSIGVKVEEFEDILQYLPKGIECLKIYGSRSNAEETSICVNLNKIIEFPNLSSLHLEDCLFQCKEAKLLSQLKKLAITNCVRTREDLLFDQMEEMKNLTHLDLTGTEDFHNLVDENFNNFERLTNLPNLTHLDVSNIEIKNKDMKYISEIKTLVHLNLSKTKIEKEGLVYLKNLTNLTHLDLSHLKRLDFKNEVLPASITHLNLHMLYIEENYGADLAKLSLKYLINSGYDDYIINKDMQSPLQLDKLEYLTISNNFFRKKVREMLPKCTVEKDKNYNQDYGYPFKWQTVPFEF